jgi:hypothetical protein
MSKLLQTMKREQAKRDMRVRKWLKDGVAKAEIAISRQRVYTLALRLK